MGVPDTTTFTLQDVVDVVNPTTDDLEACFDDAVAGDFDSSYGPGDESNLLQFRNYDSSGPTPFLGSVASTPICSQTVNITYYHNGSGTNPVLGDIVYTDSGGTAPYQYESMKVNFGGSNGSYLILKSDQTPKPGIITTLQPCP
tara:strand:+ start:36 stop:467 length:432 start_codon:yes stop_codon:yes gene_type:complete